MPGTVTPAVRTTPVPTPPPTSAPSSDSLTSPTPTPTSPPPASKSSPPIGAIVGGVIGGIAVIGAIVVAVIFLLKRKRGVSSTSGPAPAQYHQQQPMGQPPVQPMAQGYYNPSQQ